MRHALNPFEVFACCALNLASCGSPEFPTSVSFPAVRRQPPSLVADDGELGDSARQRLPSLVVPLDPDDARALVGRFFTAVLLESSADLFPLFAVEAWSTSEGNRQPAQALWRARLAQLDYGSLAGRVVGGPTSLRTYTFKTAARARQDGVPPPATPDEVVVVAKIGVAWTGKTRLFGDQLAFRLRPKADEVRFEIAEITEDFRLP